MGPRAAGSRRRSGVVPDVVIGTFGKALGTFGAFAATSRPIAELLWNRARPFVFSTALPPSVPASTLAAIEIVRGAEGEAPPLATRDARAAVSRARARGWRRAGQRDRADPGRR